MADNIRRLDERINAYGSIVTELHFRITNLEKAERKIEIALENVKDIEMQISDLKLRLEMLEHINSDMLADFNDLKEQFGLIDLGKSIT